MRRTFLLVVSFAASTVASACSQPTPIDKEVLALIERSRTTQAPYSLFLWNRIDGDNRLIEEWSAEFHSGPLHRVETPNVRIVANCARQSGHMLDIASGEVRSGPEFAKSACGINANQELEDARLKGTIDTPFGKAKRVELTDANDIRVYDIAASGALLRTTYAAKATPQRYKIITEAQAFSTDDPDPTMFSMDSLDQSFVPETYRQPPAIR